jgi:hypothetical protein
MKTYRLSVNVVVRHQKRRKEEVVSALDWEPFNAWSIGDDRVTPAGTKLPGTRQETMCAFRFEHDGDQLSSAVDEVVEHLFLRKSHVQELLDTGGTLALNIGLNGQFNSSFELDPDSLRRMSELGICLSVECFPQG